MLALQNEGWRQQMDEIQAVRTVEQLLLALSHGPKDGAKNRPQKRGRNIAGRRKGFQNGGPFLGPGCCIHSQPSLRAVSSGDSGTFRLFSWQWA